jgi:hypothetical protein
MSDELIKINAKSTSPPDLAWRGESLAELAFARVPGLIVNKHLKELGGGLAYDYLVATGGGACFFVKAEAFTSAGLDAEAERVDATAEWSRRVDAALVRRAHECGSPFFLFLFDADTDHGRFLRVDALPGPDPKAKTVDVRLPREDAIDGKALERIAAALEAAKAPE